MGLQDGRMLKLLLEIKGLVQNQNVPSNDEVEELKKQNASLKGEITKLKNKLNEAK